MTRNYERALKAQKRKSVQTHIEIYGALGLPIDGQQLVEVPDRPSFVYVRLRDNQNEVIQAFNNKVAAAYNLPVIVRREGNRNVVVGVNTARYDNNWNNYSAFLPKHGSTHSFPEGRGGDVTWVFSRQMMPTLVYPTNGYSGTNVTIAEHSLLTNNGAWLRVGGTGTVDLLQYMPSGSDSSTMVLVYLDTITGNPGIIVNSGSYPSNLLTGSNSLYPFIPAPSSPSTQIPLAAVRVSSGTSNFGWGNLYDLRQWLQPTVTGTTTTAGNTVFSGVDQIGIYGLDDGVPKGTGTWMDFGDNISLSRSGTVFRVDVMPTAGTAAFIAQDEGVPLGTGTVFNFTGAGVTTTRSGTVFNVDVSAGAGSFNFIQEITPTGATGTFSSIPQTYNKLIIDYIARSDKAAAAFDDLSLWINQDYTAGNYRSTREFTYAGGTVGAAGDNTSILENINAATSPANSCSAGTLSFPFYQKTVFKKQIRLLSGNRRDDSSVFEIIWDVGLEWENTAAINRIDFTLAGNNFVTGSTFRLYGVT